MSSWSDRLQPASFRGVPFLWEQVDTSGGRRVVVHEYPFQDEPYAEDMGLKANEFRLNAYLIGKDYDTRATALQKVLEQKGAGELITPLQGSMQAQLLTWTRTDTTGQGGIARFQLTFVRTGKARYPAAASNPTSKLIKRRTSLFDQLVTAFSDALSLWHNLRTSAAFEIFEQLAYLAELFAGGSQSISDPPGGDATATTILAWVQATVTTASSLPDLPATWATDLPALSADPETQLASILSQQTSLISRINNTLEPPQVLTLALQIQAMETAIRISLQAFGSYSQATAVQSAINDLITQTVELPALREHLSVEALNAWSALRVDIADNLASQLLVLPKVQHINVSYPLPAVVIAWRLYQDAGRSDDIITRNNLPHPGFCSGELEYLTA